MEQVQILIIDFLKTNIWDIIWIIILLVLGRIVLRKIVKKMVSVVDDGDDKNYSKLEKRAETLGGVIINIGKIVIYIIVLLMILDLFGIDIRPILAGAGVIGLAIGFGAQTLVKDFVSGLFILIEDQYSVGDRVIIQGKEGVVKKITLRSTTIEDNERGICYFSNSYVVGKEIVNLSKKEDKKS